MKPINISVDFGKPKKPFKHFYEATGYANVDFTYTEPSKRMYDYLSSYKNHFRYMRVHNILVAHGRGDYYLVNYGSDYGSPEPDSGDLADIVVDMGDDGRLKYDWTVVDRIYDIMVEHGIKPIVETVLIPSCLQKSAVNWYIPKDYNLWRELLREFALHLQDRYGKEEVEQWYFEVWNEPDNQKFWIEDSGTFMALYDYMEDGLHSVNPNLKVGGPAVKQGIEAQKLFREFLDHCANGLNYVTGRYGTRVDFISVHCKGGTQKDYNPSTNVMFDSLKIFMEILKEYPKFDGTEFFNDESDIVWGGNQGIRNQSWFNFRNTHYAPGFTCKMMNVYCSIVEDQYNINLSIVDSDNSHIQWEKFLFSGNRSQLSPLVKYPSTDLIKKPLFNSFILMSRLGNERLQTECSEAGFSEKFGVLPTIKDNLISIMAWNFEDGMEDNINPRYLKIDVKNIPYTGNYRRVHYRIDSTHSNSHNIWTNLGKPPEPAIEQIKLIREREGLELYEPVSSMTIGKEISLEIDMPMHSVSLLLLVPENVRGPHAVKFIKGVAEEGYNKNRQVFLKWKPCSEEDFLYYRILRKREDESEFCLISDNTSINTATYIDMDVKKGCSYSYKIQSVNASMVGSGFSDEMNIEV